MLIILTGRKEKDIKDFKRIWTTMIEEKNMRNEKCGNYLRSPNLVYKTETKCFKLVTDWEMLMVKRLGISA